jgi:N-acetylglutamate synthase-like GNAT family acetyltransferase
MIKIEIHRYSENYSNEVIDLILGIQQKEFDIPIDLQDQPDLTNIPGFYQKNNSNFWVAVIDRIVVGTIALLDIGNNHAALRKMFVAAAFRGNKFSVAQSLLHTAFDWADEKKINSIFLGTTERFLAAQRFYEKNDFKEIDKKELPKEFPIMKVDVKFYKHTIIRDKKIQVIKLPTNYRRPQYNHQYW